MKKDKRISPMYKVLNGRKVPVCDYHGTCTNKSYVEVYPISKGDEDKGWSYLCRKHFEQEHKRLKEKLPYCSVSEEEIEELEKLN
ncbi:hypothetical protein HN924_00915 [Candidatus Woesearchaeota archaeon]|jgi:hypothetical protein|nr:hypothetical protein [Candidatus Woesearchaeota archaeon]MBT7062514.1 hypothetical protein [Candidatus Woesearchaeota archaeon]MBT7402306.1 hypothetical protein [Candidatus Woesearchaeota archaeon]